VRVLVTGATSLIGSAVATALHQRGDDVTLFQRNPSSLGPREVLGSVTDEAAVASATKGVDTVVHLAAKVAVVGAWDEFYAINVTGTRNLVAAAQRAGVSTFVYVSSPSVAHSGSSLIGAGAGPADPDRARGHYARSKAMAELTALEAASPDLSVVAIRPHLVWGPGDTQLVGRVVERARSGKLALVGSGMALIDTTYIDNAATALIAALDAGSRLSGRALVVSNGQPRTVRELFERIAGAAGLGAPRLRVPVNVAKAGGSMAERIWDRSDRTDDPPMTSFLAEQLATAHWFDQRETRRLLDWTPHVSLEEGFERLREWFATTER
jgi:nucleoside-diphosphate-sugar epimerase